MARKRKSPLDQLLDRALNKAGDALGDWFARKLKGAGAGVSVAQGVAQRPANAPAPALSSSKGPAPAQSQLTLNVFKGPTQVVVKRRRRERGPKPQNVKKALPKNARIIDADFEVKP